MSVRSFITCPRTRQQLLSSPFDFCLNHYAERLVESGYAKSTGRRKLWAIAHFGEWILQQKIDINAIDEETVSRFLHVREQYGRPYEGDRAALTLLIALLRETGQIPRIKQNSNTYTDRIERDFENHLRQEAGLLENTVNRYRPLFQAFVNAQCKNGCPDWKALTALDVRNFIGDYAKSHIPRSTQLMCTVVRSFMRFMRYRGYITRDLAFAIPSVARAKLVTKLPCILSEWQQQQVLDHCHRITPIEKRDYAILLLLMRVGVRAAEVSALRLDDLNWQAGYFNIRAKGGGQFQLPLPDEVGEAIAGYLRYSRPPSSSRRLFLRGLAPYSGFTSNNVSRIASDALIRAGIDCQGKGAHIFRHSLATQMLRSGASLTEIGMVLNHQDPDSTRIYAKVDLVALRKIAKPWPEVHYGQH